MTLSFLADENIPSTGSGHRSPESAAHLEALGYPCRSLCREGPRRLSDREIVALAKREGKSSSPMISTLGKSTTSPKRVR
ncbi:MAG: hypothetical protein WBW48_20325 [Anaerolineae bacterium]